MHVIKQLLRIRMDMPGKTIFLVYLFSFVFVISRSMHHVSHSSGNRRCIVLYCFASRVKIRLMKDRQAVRTMLLIVKPWLLTSGRVLFALLIWQKGHYSFCNHFVSVVFVQVLVTFSLRLIS